MKQISPLTLQALKAYAENQHIPLQSRYLHGSNDAWRDFSPWHRFYPNMMEYRVKDVAQRHPHADLIIQFADNPNLKIEYRTPSDGYTEWRRDVDRDSVVAFYPDYEYRLVSDGE